MRIAVASHEPCPTGLVAARFGHAPWFVVFDTRAGRFEHLPHRLEPIPEPDAGLAAARLLRRRRVGAIIAGDFGEHALRVLLDAHVCLFTSGHVTVAQAVADFISGRLRDA